MKTETLAYGGAIGTILCLIAAVVALLITHALTLDQVGPFLAVLVLPLTAIASLPIFKAALAAPSADQLQQIQQQNQQLHGTLSQSIQALAQVAQPAQAQPLPIQVTPQGYNAPSTLQPNPDPVTVTRYSASAQPVPQQPFPPISQMTAPVASMRQIPGQQS